MYFSVRIAQLHSVELWATVFSPLIEIALFFESMLQDEELEDIGFDLGKVKHG